MTAASNEPGPRYTVTLPFDPRRHYTVEEFARLPEDNSFRYELQDGVIVVSPRPVPRHQYALAELYVQVRGQLPAQLAAFQEVDVDLQLSRARTRVPDLVIIPFDKIKQPGLQAASDLLVVVEILSPGSARDDTEHKASEYAEAGVPQYWLIDPEPPVTATILTLVDGEYEESQRAEHSFTVTEPCPLTIDLDALQLFK
ncbi:Uma2 family endonuclease [Herbihabitans rhizosphaerae]|uniref:Uma2 family endonuclease n=1 Tax=Herbihabitans rhizosphaerae TaxID=1872711 RepID=A0A4V2ERE0_9PSEU|nr:Uma2 family endonuclease [Herbihabitans rhizosphaerae]RZS30522.1 Uma2 family endonuclease [Herbihabitans rhizosphaerae]